MEFVHKSVLLDETIEGLAIKPDGIYLDGTLGGGGHSSEICRRLGDGHLIGIDQDEEALAAASERLKPFQDKITLVRDNYCNAPEVIKNLGITGVDGLVLDLGVSSYQLDNVERGFSYRYDTALDMRMDTRQSLTAREIINEYPERELYRIIRDYGEDQFAKNIAKHIAAARKEKPIETTGELNELIKAAIPARMRANGGHPSKRTFQAIRIECNHELDVLKNSLEDRIVKSAFRKNENPCTCPPDFPVCVCGKKSQGKVITRKPVLPGEEELETNSRSKSAKLRIFEKAAG